MRCSRSLMAAERVRCLKWRRCCEYASVRYGVTCYGCGFTTRSCGPWWRQCGRRSWPSAMRRQCCDSGAIPTAGAGCSMGWSARRMLWTCGFGAPTRRARPAYICHTDRPHHGGCTWLRSACTSGNNGARLWHCLSPLRMGYERTHWELVVWQ